MYTGATETDAIMNDSDALQAIGRAENEVVLADFVQGVLDLAQEIVTFETENGIPIRHEDIFMRVQDMLEAALQARATIRRKYKTGLL